MKEKGYRFGTFGGVFVPSILTIFGVVMFLRLGLIVGELGTAGALLVLLAAESIAVATGLSISAISTNTPVKSGGPYFLISRALGPGFGSSIGLSYFLSQSLSVPFYIIGFSEAVTAVFPAAGAYSLWLGLIPLTILFGIGFIGANWAIRTQYVILAVLGVSILSFLGGAALTPPSGWQFRANLLPPQGKDLNIMVLAYFFAVFFPAVTGFLSGVNMSGDLRDARKSIPRGTMLAILTGLVIYTLEILLLGGAFPLEALASKPYETLVTHAAFGTGVLVTAGVIAATLSSALGTLIGAPRILQAFAADRIFPPLNFFARGRGAGNEPAAAMIVTFAISAGIIVWSASQKAVSGAGAENNPLNVVAVLVTMFTLCTYAIINLAAFVESFAANPSFRPRFRFFHWSVGLYGAGMSLAAALFIDTPLLLAAAAIIAALFLLSRRQTMINTFGDARRGFLFARIRNNLVRLANMPPDAKNWRPQIAVLAGDLRKHRTLLEYAVLLNCERGIISAVKIVTTPTDEPEKLRRETILGMNQFAKESGLTFFSAAVAAEDQDLALNLFLQSHSIGPLSPNIVLCGWPAAEDRVSAYFSNIRTIAKMRLNCLIMLNCGRAPDPNDPAGPIDVWWRGRKNGSLMLILAYLMTRNRSWRKVPIRLLRIAPESERAHSLAEMRRLTEEARIEAECIVLPDTDGFESALRRESEFACLVFLGLVPPDEGGSETFFQNESTMLEGMPTTFLVISNGDANLSS